jgi:DtxR family transcriptional regulator, Mn-dependent transcriptional regulator
MIPTTSFGHPRSATVEDYAKAIYSLSGAGAASVATNDLADRLGVTAGSVSAMLRKLADVGLVEHVPYHGVALTPDGERLALQVLRRHRLLELFLAETLDVPWERVHAEAEILEHALSESLTELIALKLGDPTVDPHGDPIPSRELVVDERPTDNLADLAPGERGTLVRVSDTDPQMLSYLSRLGIGVGDTLQMLDRQPFDGPCMVRFGDRDHALGLPLARAMRVRREGQQP